jgi:hypothetical protein
MIHPSRAGSVNQALSDDGNIYSCDPSGLCGSLIPTAATYRFSAAVYIALAVFQVVDRAAQGRAVEQV